MGDPVGPIMYIPPGPAFHIYLGHCGPTDCTLILSKTPGPEKDREYLIESPAWRCVSALAGTGPPKQYGLFRTIRATEYAYHLCELVWERYQSECSYDADGRNRYTWDCEGTSDDRED